jgi:multicomponent Na+:H+ antiporter subunit E
MSLFLVNVLLALVWTAVTGSFSFLNFAFGFVLAILALSLIPDHVGSVG